MSVIELDPNAHKREVPSIYAEFYTVEIEDEAASKEAGYAVLKTIDKVRWGRRGQNLNILEDKIDRIKRNPAIWEIMAPAYEAWKKNQEPPLNGTALKLWPAITAKQVSTLQNVGIRTVEELMELTDGDADRLGIMEIRRLRSRAQAWKAAANDIGKFAERLTALEETAKAKDDRIAELERANSELHAALQRTGTVQAPMIPEPQRKKA